jgi:hypothetical protein
MAAFPQNTKTPVMMKRTKMSILPDTMLVEPKNAIEVLGYYWPRVRYHGNVDACKSKKKEKKAKKAHGRGR